MIIVILSVFILVFIIGLVLISNLIDEEFGFGIAGVGLFGIIASIIALICLINGVKNLSVIDQKIEMYQAENESIEAQISECVKQYQQYETEIFTEVAPESSITLISLYPELKADALVSKQIEVYVDNNEKIKELKMSKINGDITRWWLYFGGSKE